MRKHWLTYFVCCTVISSGLIQARTAHQACPSDFHGLPLISEAKFCQRFSDSFPASMTYFVPSSQVQSSAFYSELAHLLPLKTRSKGRDIFVYDQGRVTVVVSVDGKGSQVDMLVKRPAE